MGNGWMPDRLLRLLLGWTAVTFVVAWLPFIRSVEHGETVPYEDRLDV